MKHTQLPPVQVLHECFTYVDGFLFWKHRPVEHFNSQKAQKISNTRHPVGTPAYGLGANGYYTLQFAYKSRPYNLLMHRVIWTMFNGEIPKDYQIDHEDTYPANCKIGNLRLATHHNNMMNSSMPVTNTSGVKGVCKSPTAGKWMAYLSHKNKQICLGTYNSIAEAELIVTNARNNLRQEFANNTSFLK
jgi:hypothetical protein